MTYELFIIPLVAGFISQIIKLIIDASKGKFSWKDINSYGGMPSSHSSIVIALVAIMGVRVGWDSPAFAISLMLAIIIIRDAGGFRMTLGKHAKELNQIVHSLTPQEGYKFKHLRERIGHTPLELFFGTLVGIATVVLYLVIFG